MKTSNFAVSKKYFKRKELEKFSVGVEISFRNFITYIYIYFCCSTDVSQGAHQGVL